MKTLWRCATPNCELHAGHDGDHGRFFRAIGEAEQERPLDAEILFAIHKRDADWVDVGDPGTTDPRPLHASRHEGATHISGACAADAVRDRRWLLAALSRARRP